MREGAGGGAGGGRGGGGELGLGAEHSAVRGGVLVEEREGKIQERRRRAQQASDALKDRQMAWLRRERRTLVRAPHARRLALLLRRHLSDLQVEPCCLPENRGFCREAVKLYNALLLLLRCPLPPQRPAGGLRVFGNGRVFVITTTRPKLWYSLIA